MKILCIGHSCYDISLPVEEYPIENTKYRLSDAIECGGGSAGNAAYLLAKWQQDTYMACGMGNDIYGHKILSEFESVNINTDYVELSDELATSIAFIFINKKNGSRTAFTIAKKHHELQNTEYIIDPNIIFLDGHDYNASIKALNQFPNAISIIDAGRVDDNLIDLCSKVNYVVTSKGFAENISGLKIDYNYPETITGCYTELMKRFPNATIIVTLEEKGAMFLDNDEIRIMSGLNLTPRDTTGAGDIFHGAFTYAIANNYDLENAVRIANIAAGLSITKMGARLSVPTLEEVFNYGK